MELLFWICLALVGYTYLAYPIILWTVRAIRRKETPIPTVPEYHPFVSVVISCYNEERNLAEKIHNIDNLDYPQDNLECLFGSDGSTDGTVRVLAAHHRSNVECVDFKERRGKAAVLNDLIPRARGEIIILSDANTMFQHDTVSKLVKPFADTAIGAVCGALSLQSDAGTAGGVGESLYWKYENGLKKMESDVGTTIGATGGVYAVRKSMFTPLPSSKAIPDDFVLPMNVLREGARIVYEPQAIAFEAVSNSVLGEFQRKVRIGTTDYSSISELVDLLHPRVGFAAFALWSRKIVRWFVPHLLVVVLLVAAYLSMESDFFRSLLFTQLLFYAMAGVGFFMERLGIRMGIVGLPYYFTAMNLALLIGFFRFLTGKKQFTWEVVR